MIAEISAADRVTIRDVADGAGPSHVIPMGPYILVVDPWNMEIRRYQADDIHGQPAICLFPRTFAPGRVSHAPDGVRLIAEPYGPDGAGGYDLRAREAMTITPALVARMPIVGPCRFPIAPLDRHDDTPPPIRSGHAAEDASYPLPGGALARIAPQAGPGWQVFAVRRAGELSDGRVLLWWSEVGNERAEADDAGPGQAEGSAGGRLMASQFVGVFDAAGGTPRTVVRIITALVPPLRPDHSIPIATLLEKPGLEYVAGAPGPNGDAIWIAAANTDGPGRGRFELQRYDLAALGDAARGRIALVDRTIATEPVGDGDGPTSTPEADGLLAAASPRVPAMPYAKARETLEAQIAFRWQYPRTAWDRPCDGRTLCDIGADHTGALGTGPAFPVPVRDRVNPEGGARWVQPRQLVGLLPGAWVSSVPYSIGGADLAEGFAARLAAGYGGDAANPPPIGHIGEGLEWQRHGEGEPEWHEDQANYPLGIDCSALIARVFDLRIRSTGTMVSPRLVRGADGRGYQVPAGPDRACPQPVRSIHELREGDIILRNGHVVIFNGFAAVGDSPGVDAPARSRVMRVFEATSRCGAVCESLYDPSYFAGWWMLRLDLADEGANCPFWLGERP
ncbi:hypothetical protein [Novosphingobium sp. PC22D]|uniref:hypothetical protein n=1 Tax=Novosphingobium sp. PC22D TaxID=1962403 RepID=UPI00143A25B1|nr:hypothetical protein [Novosphingobium sp. PC22D]